MQKLYADNLDTTWRVTEEHFFFCNSILVKHYSLHTDGDAQAISTVLPQGFLLSLSRVECNGSESVLSHCPHIDTTCLNPGAGVICPLPVTMTTSVTEAPVSQDGSSTANETKQASFFISATLLVLIFLTLYL